jgi:hypothetical protein
LFDLITLNNTWREAEIVKFKDIQFSLALYAIFSAVQMVYSNILSLCSSVDVDRSRFTYICTKYKQLHSFVF